MDLVTRLKRGAGENYRLRRDRLVIVGRSFDDGMERLVETAKSSRAGHLDSPLSALDSYVVFGDAGDHYDTVLDMARFASDDLHDILMEDKNAARHFDRLQSLRREGRRERALLERADYVDQFEQHTRSIKRAVHSFPVRLSTLIDNLYYLSAGYYGLSTTCQTEERKNIEKQLRGINARLGNYLRRKLNLSERLSELYCMRNRLVHNCPNFGVLGNDRGDLGVASVFTLAFDKGEKQEPVFEYLFEFYKLVLERALGAVDLLLQKPPRDANA